MTGTKNPYSTVFWNDIEHDEKLKTCSLAAKGLWLFNMLPAAARSPEYGVVIVGDWPSKLAGDLPTVLANVAGQSRDVVEALLDELINSGTASVDEHGRVFNRRMVKERKLSQTRSEAGRLGAHAKWQTSGKHHGKRDGKTPEDELPLSGGEYRGIPEAEPDAGWQGDGKPMATSYFGASNRESLTEERGASRAEGAPPAGPKKRPRKIPQKHPPEGAGGSPRRLATRHRPHGLDPRHPRGDQRRRSRERRPGGAEVPRLLPRQGEQPVGADLAKLDLEGDRMERARWQHAA